MNPPAQITPCLAPLGEAPHARLPCRHGDARPGRHPDPLHVSDQPLTCRANPAPFAIEDVSTVDDACARERATTQAKQACSGCPVVTQCLKWGLANPDLTQPGVWVATTKRDRKRLHKQLVARLGDNCELPFVSASATTPAPMAAEPADLPRPTFAPPLHQADADPQFRGDQGARRPTRTSRRPSAVTPRGTAAVRRHCGYRMLR
ncbi:WhiB family transcriptional regulator [Streptomyces microflavus]